jgi:DNA-binding response OmpR family regulator
VTTGVPTVLIVDDEPQIADTLAIVFKMAGVLAFPCHSGDEALWLIDSLTPDILLTDVMMPGMSGIDLAIAVSARKYGTKILLLSRNAATRDLLEDAKAKGHEFEIIAKPVPPQELINRVRALAGS